MSVKHYLGSVLLAGGFALALSGQSANADGIFTITSSSFKDGQLLGKKYAGNNKANPNCVGENISPQLSWTNVPAGTQSFALVVHDPEGRGTGVDHWVAYGIPASVTSFAEGEVSNASEKYVGGISTMKLGHYFGPCTPPNQSPHHYTFILIATDLDPKALPPGLSRLELFEKLNGHVKGSSGIIGLFKNPL
jgi:Raf kinase inhibitor-like YbhB/YbcL family protein